MRGGIGSRRDPVGEPGRILLILTGLLGDSVMCTPVIVEARRLWPDARIAMLGNKQTCALLAACPLIDERVEAAAIPFTIRKKREVAKLSRWIRSQDFDLAIILLGDQFALVLAEAGIPARVGAAGHALEPCLTATYDIKSPKDWGPSERLGALRTLGYEVSDVPPLLWVADDARRKAREWLAGQGIAGDARYAVIHPFGSTPRQRWPIERVIELGRALHAQYAMPSIIVGGPETTGKVPGPGSETLVDATGALSIQELLALMDGAALVISTDSGPFHIAGALGRPLIGLFRARRPEHAARYPQARVVLGQDSTCQARCRWDHCRELPCRQLSALSVGEVLDAVVDLDGMTVLSSSNEKACNHD